ncbi:ABC transporter-like protein [Calycina marina]|uniref:ABC transporter-like protein n=1 Tax=Calycina marina TaxID=1763456 RepID=A0A9P7ZC85_9HELO|nr:ABC transporter-like protein [Calycina marina]
MEKDIESGLNGRGDPIGAVHVDEPKPLSDGVESKNTLQPISTSQSNGLSFSEVEQVDVEIRNLSVTVDTKPSWSLPAFLSRNRNEDGVSTQKDILYSVSASMPAGSITAIIGGSGSGKTTLLNTISGRMPGRRLSIGGTAQFNSISGINSIRSAYVIQQDVLLPTLTIIETLRYSADLRLPPPTTKEERRKVVEEVIMELGLKECADTRIGNHQNKGCSGGERRRTSIGVQPLSNPSVLFLDEPTTGLDATSAFQLIRTLKILAKKGRTIITTIHQPRSEIWGMFDHLVILTRGSPLYAGRADSCLLWFENNSIEFPPFVNPAEFLIDAAAIDNRTSELEEASATRVKHLKDAWEVESDRLYSGAVKGRIASPTYPTSPKDNSLSRRHSPFIRQTRVLTARTFLTTYRDPLGMVGSLVEAIGMGIMAGWVFYQLERDQSGIRSRQGALYNSSALQGYLILMFETYRLSVDVEVFDRENNENVVDVLPFLLSRRIARLPMEDLPVPLLYSIITYWMSDLRSEPSSFFVYFAIILLSQYIAVTFAMACISASRKFATASLIANMGYTVQSLACGFFLQSNSIPIYLRWLKWTAYVFYAFGALCANEFVGNFYACPYEDGAANPACKDYTGSYIMESLGFPEEWLVVPICALLGFVLLFHTCAFVGLRYKKVHMTIAHQRNVDTDLSAGKEKMAARSIEMRTIDIGLDNFALDLERRTAFGRKLPTKTILNPITTTFKGGLLNVIMGPSGSGKTSLLNAMALRLRNSAGTQYKKSGAIHYNGATPFDTIIRSVCSYVCHDDDALLSSLTVRETLYFAASLRLPAYMTIDEKKQQAEKVLRQLGLKDCANNLIGSDIVKGISGGEKRRVSIAVQILTDPQVLLLDEPTSGLDAFTASSIMEVLFKVAQEGRTIILTIHQSRSDLFKDFGNVLLARGGSPVYTGKASDMLPHFDKLGFPCPTTTNPADFVLDLITIDLQYHDREEMPRTRVQTLIESHSSNDHSTTTASNETPSTHGYLGGLTKQQSPFIVAYPILVHRAFINSRRQPPLIIARTMQVTGLAIILTLFFAPLKNDYFAVQNRLGFIQEFCAFYFVGMLQNVAVYPGEKDVFYRENDDGAYGVEAFLAQYLTLEVPFEIITSFLFAILVDLAAGLPKTTQMFFVCFFNCFCIVSCGESLGIIFNTIFDHTGFAVNLTSVFLSVATFMSGIMSINMPGFLQGVNYLSPLGYAMRNMAPYSLRDIMFTCIDEQRLANRKCPITNGMEALELYNLNKNPALNLMALGLCTVVYRLLAFATLKARRHHRGDRHGSTLHAK